jgi:hypothetical protein
MDESNNIPVPLLVTFIAQIDGQKNIDYFVSNTRYNTRFFSRIPFYKPISLISAEETLILTLNDLNDVPEEFNKII